MKKLAVRYRIARNTGRILDVGSGNNALDIATHIVDLMPNQDVERGGRLELPEGKVFKEGSLEKIPYPDRFFDFIHTSHVLEHVEDPRKALSEMARVAFSGYVETPAAVLEQGVFGPGASEPGWSYHRWMVWHFPGSDLLFLKPKTPRSLNTFCGCEWGEAYKKIAEKINLIELDPHLPYFCKMAQVIWEKSPRFEIWSEEQQGSFREDLGRCSCAYSAFFAWGRIYFRSLIQFRRRLRFKRALPEIYRIYRVAAH